jgi:SAM-dependent methyltransferase
MIVAAGWLTTSRPHWPCFVALSLVGTAWIVFLRRDLEGVGAPFVIGVAVAVRLLLLPVPPTLSDDAYRFAWDARVQAEGFNVYAHTPADSQLVSIEYPPVRHRLNSAEYYSVYPPASQVAFMLGALIGGGSWPGSLFGIKFVLVLAEIFGLFILARLVRPGLLALYALNPVVIIETAAQSHTEALLIPAMLGAILLLRAKRIGSLARSVAAGMALGVGTLVKLYPALWLPPFVRRGGAGVVVGFSAVVGLIGAPFYAPGVAANVRESLDLYVRLFEFNAGPYYLVKEALLIATGHDWSKLIGPIMLALSLGLVAVVVVADWRSTRRAAGATIASGERSLPLERVMFRVLAIILVFATTVHPWYFVPLIALLVVDGTRSLAWLWLAALSHGTYLFYTASSNAAGFYWLAVWTGWLGWFIILCLPLLARRLDGFIRLRGRQKARRILPFLPIHPEARILDLGCGEGYVGSAITEQTQADVLLMDVVDYHRADLPFILYDGVHVPLASNAVDAVFLYFVLHHARDPSNLLKEALRVSSGAVVIVESTYQRGWERRVLTIVDHLANSIRSRGRMSGQREFLQFRSAEGWREELRRIGAWVVEDHQWGTPPHRQVMFVCKGTGASASVVRSTRP